MNTDRNHFEGPHQENSRRESLGLRLKTPPHPADDWRRAEISITVIGLILATLTVALLVFVISL